jgi:hypothetical protein
VWIDIPEPGCYGRVSVGFQQVEKRERERNKPMKLKVIFAPFVLLSINAPESLQLGTFTTPPNPVPGPPLPVPVPVPAEEELTLFHAPGGLYPMCGSLFFTVTLCDLTGAEEGKMGATEDGIDVSVIVGGFVNDAETNAGVKNAAVVVVEVVEEVGGITSFGVSDVDVGGGGAAVVVVEVVLVGGGGGGACIVVVVVEVVCVGVVEVVV